MDWPATNFSLRFIFEEKTWAVRGMNKSSQESMKELFPYHPKSLTRGAMDFGLLGVIAYFGVYGKYNMCCSSYSH